MTRLQHSDIKDIPSSLTDYNDKLKAVTGRSLIGIACHAYNVDETKFLHDISNCCIHIIPITTGQGVITNFVETVCSILKFIGFNALVSEQTDISGIASAVEKKSDAVMMADDIKFVGLNLNSHKVVDNSRATGNIFAAALDLMAKGIKKQNVLVMGCGSVGEAALRKILHLKGNVSLYDSHTSTSTLLKTKLCKDFKNRRIQIEKDIKTNFSKYDYIIEATPSKNSIPDEVISKNLMVAAPGVPLGISKKGCNILKNRLVHDKLELGVAAMAVSLLP